MIAVVRGPVAPVRVNSCDMPEGRHRLCRVPPSLGWRTVGQPVYAPTYQEPVLLSQHCSVVLPSASVV